MRLASVYVTLLLCILPATANVEKTVFIAPPVIHVPTEQPNLDGLQIATLTPLQSSLRLHLDAAFPSAERPQGVESWYLLDKLNQGQRYEVRICWSATVSQATRPAAYARQHRSACVHAHLHTGCSLLSARFGNANNYMAATDVFRAEHTYTVSSLRNTCPHFFARFILGNQANSSSERREHQA